MRFHGFDVEEIGVELAYVLVEEVRRLDIGRSMVVRVWMIERFGFEAIVGDPGQEVAGLE